MKPAWECCSVTQARHSIQLAGDSVSLSPGDTNGALYGRGIPDTVAGSLLMQGCGLRGPAGHVAEELGPQVRKSSSSPRGDSAGWCQGCPGCCPSSSWPLQRRIWLPLYQHGRDVAAELKPLVRGTWPKPKGWALLEQQPGRCKEH